MSEEISLCPDERERPSSILNDKICEKVNFPYLFPNGKFGYSVNRDIKPSCVDYLNQHFFELYTVACIRPSLYILCFVSFPASKPQW